MHMLTPPTKFIILTIMDTVYLKGNNLLTLT